MPADFVQANFDAGCQQGSAATTDREHAMAGAKADQVPITMLVPSTPITPPRDIGSLLNFRLIRAMLLAYVIDDARAS
ncbi:hypothetical protein [Phyllobacterium phragmitis]|uniref:hypothetical protein n=1 Tax=Phyllobacterium phragmitis TaxID=2670329 RepID=UPI0011B23C7F|nr:hypothetical protein [Phyllobacterium phragmitis]